jgi:hypothetical protein
MSSLVKLRQKHREHYTKICVCVFCVVTPENKETSLLPFHVNNVNVLQFR